MYSVYPLTSTMWQLPLTLWVSQWVREQASHVTNVEDWDSYNWKSNSSALDLVPGILPLCLLDKMSSKKIFLSNGVVEKFIFISSLIGKNIFLNLQFLDLIFTMGPFGNDEIEKSLLHISKPLMMVSLGHSWGERWTVLWGRDGAVWRTVASDFVRGQMSQKSSFVR